MRDGRIQSGWSGWRTGNRKKRSSSQAQLGQATYLAVAWFLSVSCATSTPSTLYTTAQMLAMHLKRSPFEDMQVVVALPKRNHQITTRVSSAKKSTFSLPFRRRITLRFCLSPLRIPRLGIITQIDVIRRNLSSLRQFSTASIPMACMRWMYSAAACVSLCEYLLLGQHFLPLLLCFSLPPSGDAPSDRFLRRPRSLFRVALHDNELADAKTPRLHHKLPLSDHSTAGVKFEYLNINYISPFNF